MSQILEKPVPITPTPEGRVELVTKASELSKKGFRIVY
jgi:hypothetical protein